MRITLLLLFYFFHPFLIVAYNLDPEFPDIFELPADQSDFYFGYSVLLSSQVSLLPNGSSVRQSWIFVGAPRANYPTNSNHGKNRIPVEPGVAYRCSIGKRFQLVPRLSGHCKPINITNPDDETGFIDQVQQTMLIEKGHGWMGAAMSSDNSTGSLTICAPRTIVRIYDPLAADQTTMHGVCYSGNVNNGTLHIIDKNLSTYNFTSDYWNNPANGFAVHYPTRQKTTSDRVRPVIGSPMHQVFGSVRKIGQHRAVELPIGDDVSYFGYALTSGCYFREDQPMVAAGAPGWRYVGQVAIMDPRTEPLSIIMLINGEEVGERFGESLATGDLNNDGLDDLIVGSPHWGNDNGRVQIFLGNKAGFYVADVVLEGSVDDALYGYAVTSGDLDGDGADDLIVGAPWEKGGVVYVYNGDVKLDKSKLLEPSQKIRGNMWEGRFGFSLSKPVDVDGNRFPDLAVGAYKSGRALIYYSMPVMKTTIALSTKPKILHRNSTGFLVSIFLASALFSQEDSSSHYEISITVDKDYQRVEETEVEIQHTLHNPSEPCQVTHVPVELKTINRNYVDVIEIAARVTHVRSGTFDEYFQVEYKQQIVEAQMKLPFDIGCGLDDICHASIYAELEFQGARNSTWIIGSDDLRLVMNIQNHGEPAYSTTVTFDIPRGINMRSILPSCREDGDSKATRVTCDVGNPLETTMKKSLSLELDMSDIRNGEADGTTMNFNATVKTRAVNSRPSIISIPLLLKANVSVALSGKAHESHYYVRHNETLANLTFNHIYQIARHGATPIIQALLTVVIPYKLDGAPFLFITQKPRVFVVDRFYECSTVGIPVVLPVAEKSPSNGKIANNIRLEPVASHSRSRRAEANYSQPLLSDNVDKLTAADNANVTLVNCSTPGVTCGQVFCEINVRTRSRDLGKLDIQLMFVNDSRLIGGDNEKERILRITTAALVEVLDPKMRFVVPGTGNVVSVTTTVRRAAYAKGDVSIWIILGSVLLGLLVLCVAGFVLWKIGFFRRSKKEELENLKTLEDLPMGGAELLQDDPNSDNLDLE